MNSRSPVVAGLVLCAIRATAAPDTVTAATTLADLSVVKSGPSSAAVPQNITFTLTVHNGGPSDAANVQLTDVIPPSTVFISLTQSSGPIFTCLATSHGPALPCGIPVLPAGASATFSYVLVLTAGGTLVNTATASTTTTDPTPGNDTSSVVFDVAPAPAPPPPIPALAPATLTLLALILGALAVRALHL